MRIIEIFESHANAEKAVKMKRYMRDQFEFLGISSVERKLLFKDYLKEKGKEEVVNWSFVDDLWKEEAREFQYLAIDYLTRVKKLLTAYDLPRIRDLALKKSWWDTIDALDAIVGSIVSADSQAKKVMLDWSVDENFWIRRLAIDHQLLFKEKTDEALLAAIIENNLGSNEFFINKAIGWSLRQYSKYQADWVNNFVKVHEKTLDKLSLREASKYL